MRKFFRARYGTRLRKLGSVTVEFVLLFPLLLAVAFAALEGGRAFAAYNLLTYAVRQGARLAAVQPNLQINDPTILAEIDTILGLSGSVPVSRTVFYAVPLEDNRLVTVQAQLAHTLLFTLPTGPITVILKAESLVYYEIGVPPPPPPTPPPTPPPPPPPPPVDPQ